MLTKALCLELLHFVLDMFAERLETHHLPGRTEIPESILTSERYEFWFDLYV